MVCCDILYILTSNRTNQMIIQIIPDIHNKWFEAEEIIDKCGADKVVFLGDYFDSLGDTVEKTEQTANWLKRSLKSKKRTHLMGNHDLSYYSEFQRCSGFSESKLWAIRGSNINLGHLSSYCWVDDWLCTHAGLSMDFYRAHNINDVGVNDFLEYMVDKNMSRLYDCSAFRGGMNAQSGIFWCDYDEFQDIPGYKQIFGHTHGEPRVTTEHICIDTWLKYYGLYNTDTKNMMVKKVG